MQSEQGFLHTLMLGNISDLESIIAVWDYVRKGKTNVDYANVEKGVFVTSNSGFDKKLKFVFNPDSLNVSYAFRGEYVFKNSGNISRKGWYVRARITRLEKKLKHLYSVNAKHQQATLKKIRAAQDRRMYEDC